MAGDNQQFCLRWNNHQSTLISVFDSLLESGTLVDCTLAAEGQYLKAHKVVLSACSPYLELLLSQHYEKHPIVILKDVKFQELKSMMDYMYRGEVNITQDQLATFLKAAESLQIKGLSESSGDDARDVGSTAKRPREEPPPRRQVNPHPQARLPHSSGLTIEPRRSIPHSSDKAPESPMRSREGSTSPVARKRRRRRPSTGEDASNAALSDSQLETSNSCDLPPISNQAQSTPVSVPSILATPSASNNQPIESDQPLETDAMNRFPNTPGGELMVKTKMEPNTDQLIEPKTEYLDDMNNEDSVEDLTLDDDDEMPGPSHADGSNQNFSQWQMSGDRSTDEVFMAAQEAVGAHRDSQGERLNKSVRKISTYPELEHTCPILYPEVEHTYPAFYPEIEEHSDPLNSNYSALFEQNLMRADVPQSLKEFLDQCNYKLTGEDKEDQRRDIVRKCVEYMILKSEGKSPTVKLRIAVAEELVELYPMFRCRTDKGYEHFADPNNYASGYFANRLKTINARLARSVKKKKRVSVECNTVTDPDDNEAFLEVIEKLKNAVPEKDLAFIREAVLQNAYLIHAYIRKHGEIVNLKETFPCFYDVKGLITLCFEKAFEHANDKIDSWWTEYKSAVTAVIKESPQKSYDASLQDWPEDIRRFLSFVFLFPSREKKTSQEKYDDRVVSGIIRFKKTGVPIEECLAKIDVKQPVIIGEGTSKSEITKFIIVIDKNQVSTAEENFFEAFDIIYKSYFLFNIEFNPSIKLFLKFLDAYVYKVSKKVVMTSKMREVYSNILSKKDEECISDED